MKPSRSSFILAFVFTIFAYHPATSIHTFIRKDDIIEDCKIVSQCLDNETTLDTNTSSFITTDFDTGTVKVILPGSFERLLLTSREEEPCDYDGFLHSTYNCKIHNENMSSECIYQEVTFQYLFTSCYSIYYEYNDTTYDRLAYGYVRTNYTRDKLKEDCSFKADVELVQERYTHISVNITPFLHNSVLRIYVNDEECLHAPSDDNIWWAVEIKEDPNDNVITEKNELENRTVDCTIAMNGEIGFHQLRCEVDWADILCIMFYREKTNSPINDAVCRNVSYQDISRLQPFSSIERTSPAAAVSTTTNTLFLMFIPLTAVVVCVSLKLYLSDKKAHLPEVPGRNSTKDSPYMKCKVLLLYPQDCDAFMATMKSLQNFLRLFNNFEVYDFFDPSRFGEIACDPQRWISRLLTQKDVRIILAETDTAVLHQLAIDKKCVVNYVSPLPYSNLFTYGLQNLLQSLRPQEYSRIFLIRFEDIAQDKENLKLSRYQRYKLPEHLRNLISSMSNCNVILFKEAEESIEMKRLKHSIDEFRQFQQYNPTYHAKMCSNLTKLI